MGYFSRVLPAKGSFTLFTGSTGPDGKLSEQRHWNGLQSHEAIEKKIQELSTRPLNVFFATGNYAGPNRSDPIAKRALFLDLDSKDFTSIQDALLGLSTFVRTVGLPPPSIYVHSGRGVHVYWCLDRDVPVAEWLPVAKALKAKCEELGFTADPTPTADPARVLRAPGTLNRKEASPIPCRILSDNGASYPLAQLAAQLMPGVGLAGTGSTASRLASLAPADALITKANFKPLSAAEVASMLSYIELPAIGSRDLWIQILCSVQDWGKKSEESWSIFDAWSTTQPAYNQHENRKIWDSFEPDGGITVGTLVKMAVEAGYEPPGVPAPVTPASLAEQVAAGPEAKEIDDDPVVHSAVTDPLMIATQHAVNAGGKSRFGKDEAVQFLANEFVIITEQKGIYYSVTKREPLPAQVIDDLLTRYMPLNANSVPTNATLIMRRYGVRHSVQSLGFHPTAPAIYAEHGKSYVNQYSAPAAMIPGTPQEIALLDNFWDYMFPLAEDQAFSLYMKQCYGHLVQHPEIKIESAPLIISPEFGTGKTTIAYEFPRRLAGEANTQAVSNKTLRSTYSSYINGKQFLHFDEVHINGKWDSDDTANSLKSLIAGSMVEVHPKFMSPFNIPNRVFVTATSNYEDAMSLPTDGERRWGVYAHQPTRQWTPAQKSAYFAVLYRWLKSPRASGVLRWYFAQVSLTGFNPSAPPPITDAKKRMVSKSQIKEVRVLCDAMDHGDAPFDRALVTCDRIRQFLHAETGKTYSGYEVREFFARAVPGAMALKQVRSGQTRIRPLCWRDKLHWMDAARTPDDIKKELGST
jgi:hypothetical protein